MTAPDSPRPFEVADAQQARLLTDPRSVGFFKPFLACERSVAEAARELGCPLSTLRYRVGTFLRAGLLTVTREQRRAGRAVKHYRSAHDAYVVPFRLTPHATLEERLTEQAAPIFERLIRSYAAVLVQSGRFGQHLYRDVGGVVWTTDLPPHLTLQGLPVVYSDAVTQLADREARDVGDGLRALFMRGTHSNDHHGKRRPYLLMVAMLPPDGD